MCCADIMLKAGHEVRGLFVNYGQAALNEEMRAAKAVAQLLDFPLDTLQVSSRTSFGAGEVVGRNLFLVSAAITFAPFDHGLIVLGIHAGAPYYDCSENFSTKLNTLVEELCDGRFLLSTPLLQLEKQDVYHYASTHNLPFELAYSCERGVVGGCGDCLSCQDRKAFRNLLSYAQ